MNVISDCFLNSFLLRALLQVRPFPVVDFIKQKAASMLMNLSVDNVGDIFMKSILCKKLSLNSLFNSSSGRFHVKNVLMYCSELLSHLSNRSKILSVLTNCV